MDEPTTLQRIRTLLHEAGISFRELHHEPTLTSEEAARVRGEDLRNGAKALLVKVDDTFRLFVLPAHRKFKSSAVKKEFRAKRVRFATAEELAELTGLLPGSVPPFGQPILPFELCVDELLEENERVAFNAGSLTDSVIMSRRDYLSLAQPRLFSFSQPSA